VRWSRLADANCHGARSSTHGLGLKPWTDKAVINPADAVQSISQETTQLTGLKAELNASLNSMVEALGKIPLPNSEKERFFFKR